MRNAHIKNFSAHENLSSFSAFTSITNGNELYLFLSECGEDCKRMKNRIRNEYRNNG